MKTEILENFYIHKVETTPSVGNKVMILLHGLGDSLESYKSFAKEINVTGLSYLLVNAPVPYFDGHSWYDIPPGDPSIGIDKSVEILSSIIEQIHLKEGLAYEDIILCGFSQGGCIVLETAYKLQVPLAGVAALSPRIYPERISYEQESTILKTPVLCCHGKYDPVIPVTQTSAGIMQIEEDSKSSVELKIFDIGHEICIEEIQLLRRWINKII